MYFIKFKCFKLIALLLSVHPCTFTCSYQINKGGCITRDWAHLVCDSTYILLDSLMCSIKGLLTECDVCMVKYQTKVLTVRTECSKVCMEDS